MSSDLVRFSVAMPEDLLINFDHLVARRGLAKNRSEVIRDLVRDALVEGECATPGRIVMGTLTIVYSHHAKSCTLFSIVISIASSRRSMCTSTKTTALK